MLGDGEAVTIGAPLVDGATVNATLIETRKGDKVKIFKKIRRQGYRRTKGHRQHETVLRVTSVAGAGKTDKWDGVVSLTTKRELDARARGLAFQPLGGATPKATSAPGSPASFSTTRRSPAWTRYCLPPVLITAYMVFALKILSSQNSSRPRGVPRARERSYTAGHF